MQILLKNRLGKESKAPNTSERDAQDQPVAKRYKVKASCPSVMLGIG